MADYSAISEKKRVQVLDILRGLALFGILVVNANDYRYHPSISDPGFNELNVWFNNIIIAVAEGSFYPLFSILFGIGFAIWMDKTMKQNGGVLRFAWRSILLLLLAAIFWCFVEPRDILIRYSFLSFPLLLFYKSRPRILLIFAFVFLMLAFFSEPILKKINDNASASEKKAQIENFNKERIAYDAAEKSKRYIDFVKARFIQLPSIIKFDFSFKNITEPIIFCMFLLGVYSWRKRIFIDIDKFKLLWRKVFWFGLTIGVVGNTIVFVLRILGFEKVYMPNPTLIHSIETIADPSLTFLYISLIVFSYQKLKANRGVLLRVLGVAGRIPLTNYFLQYIIMSIIMWPYGLGLDSKLFSQELLLVSIGVFSLQLLFSWFWVKRFDYGPMEWLWRSLTYLRIQKIKKSEKSSAKISAFG